MRSLTSAGPNIAVLGSPQAAEDEARGGNVVTSGESSFLARVLGPVAELAQNDPDRLNRIFTDRLAKSIILLVPVFALLLFALT